MASPRELHTNPNGGRHSRGDRVLTVTRLPRGVRDQLNLEADLRESTVTDLLGQLVLDFLDGAARTRPIGHGRTVSASDQDSGQATLEFDQESRVA